MKTHRIVAVVLMASLAVLLLGGVASAIPIAIPTVAWTISNIAVSATDDEDTANLDGKLLAYEVGDRIAVRNLATGVTRLIPTGGGIQAEPDVSGDRVVYMNNADGDYDIYMYHWSSNTVTTVRNSVDYEGWPRIDGNDVVWYNNTDGVIEGRCYDMGGYTFTAHTGGSFSLYDIDNGRLVICDAGGSNALWYKKLRPSGDWVMLEDFAETVNALRLHGDHVALSLLDGGGDYDVKSVDIPTGAVTDIATLDDQDDEYPWVFHQTYAWHDLNVDPQIQYDRPTRIGFTPAFGGTEDDRFASLYGHRIAYQRSDLGDSDIMLATTTSKLVDRTYGTNRYATAAQTSKAYFVDATNVVLCSGENFPDALSAAPLARLLNAPLLLTRTNGLPTETAAELTRLGPANIFVIGGEPAVSKAVYDQLDATYAMDRISGDDRYETSAAVAERIFDIVGTEVPHRAFFARGDAFPDALAVGPVAANVVAPILLVRTTSVPSAISTVVDSRDVTLGYIIGSEAAVDAPTEARIRELIVANGAIGTITERWWGNNRYETATAVATKGLEYRWVDLDTIGVAIGTNFPDALGGGSALGYYGSPVILTSGTALSGATGVFLDAHAYEVGRVDVFGSTDVFSDAVKNAIAAKVR